MDWFLNNRDLRHEWVKENLTFRSQEAYFGLCEKFMLWLLLFCENIFGLLEKLWYSRLTESKEMHRFDKNILTQSWLWTHLSMFSFNLFYTPWKHQKTFRFSVFRGYRKATPGCNGLKISLVNVNKYQIIRSSDVFRGYIKATTGCNGLKILLVNVNKYQIIRFSVFRGYRKATPGCNGLKISLVNVNKHQIITASVYNFLIKPLIH